MSNYLTRLEYVRDQDSLAAQRQEDLERAETVHTDHEDRIRRLERIAGPLVAAAAAVGGLLPHLIPLLIQLIGGSP